MKKVPPISVVMVVCNEEILIERALKSVAGLADEIIIVHDGICKDKTTQIASKYTNKIYIKNHIGEAEPHRIFTYKIAKNNYILQLDADEYLTPLARKFIINDLKNCNYDIFDFKWRIRNSDTHKIIRYKSFLFNKNKVYFIGGVHEYVKPINSNVKKILINIEIGHAPKYDNYTFKIFKSKWIPWAKIHAKGYSIDFSKLQKWNYQYKNWDYPTNLKLKHPILIGMFGSFIYHIVNAIFTYDRRMSFFYIKQEIYMALYLQLVYFYFIKNKLLKNNY